MHVRYWQYIIFYSIIFYSIGEQVVERVDNARMLGMTISNNLTWSKHVDNIVGKAGKRVYIIVRQLSKIMGTRGQKHQIVSTCASTP